MNRINTVTMFIFFGSQTCLITTALFWLQERETHARKLMLDGERRRREEVEKRLQEETVNRQQLIEKEVKLRAKNFSQVRSRRSVTKVHCVSTGTANVIC